MKKAMLLVAMIVASFSLTACNYQMVDLQYKYNKVHINNTGCFEIKSWRDYDGSEQIQVTLKDDSVMLISSLNCVLIKGKCPICGN